MAKKGKGSGSWALALLGFAAGILAVVVFIRLTEPDKPPMEAPKPQAVVPLPDAAPVAEPAVEPPKTFVPPPRVSIVIDDMGGDLKTFKELMALDAPVTIAVMPHMKHSKEIAAQAHAKGLEVIMHLPMEPKDMGDNDPGPGALLVAMRPDEVRTQMENDLKTIPYAIGVNNHMGSRFTEDEGLMRTVLDVAKKNRLFFLDSRTSSNSVAGRLARELAVSSADRSVFLDNTRDKNYIKGQIRELAAIARKKGKAIGIGHPYPETIAALKEAISELENEGVEVVGLSELVQKR